MKLEVRQVTYEYPGRPGQAENRKILKDFSLTADSGERVGLMAPSGFGKTTLCKLMAGYLEPDAGDIRLDGKKLSSYRGYCPVQMIWQQPELAVDPLLRMREMIAEGDAVEPRILEELGIRRDWMDRFPGELSGGELQRFCIARALGRRTAFLLADEITTMLDLITQKEVWHFLLEETRRRGIGLVAVSHDRDLLECICTRVVEMI